MPKVAPAKELRCAAEGGQGDFLTQGTPDSFGFLKWIALR